MKIIYEQIISIIFCVIVGLCSLYSEAAFRYFVGAILTLGVFQLDLIMRRLK